MSPRLASAITLEHVLLALLDQKPMHGYELFQELSEMRGISQIWNVKQGLLYAILDKLEEKGFLSSRQVEGGPYHPRKIFHLTDVGKASLYTWIKTPVRRARDLRQEFLAKLIVARRYGIAETLNLIQLQEQSCLAWLDELAANAPSQNQDQMDEWLVYSFRINRVQGVLAWLKGCQLELDRLMNREPTIKP